MEYTIDKLDEAICYYLSLHKDEAISIQRIYNELCTENICPDLKNYKNREMNKITFTSLCHIMDTKIEGIQKIYKGTTLYLVLTDKSKYDIAVKYGGYDKLVDDKSIPSVLPPQDIVLEHILSTADWNNKYSLTDRFNETDTVMHIICRKGNRNLLKKMMNEFDFDPYLKNTLGQTLMDVLPRTDEGFMMLTDLLTYDHDKKMFSLRRELQDVKICNTKCSDLSYSSRMDAEKFKNDYERLSRDKLGMQIAIVVLVMAFLYMLFARF